jgi:nicotinamide-nucleotide amidase
MADTVVRLLRDKMLTLVLAESCTAGKAASAIASIPGASNVFWGGFVTYQTGAKTKMLGVTRSLLRRYGAVSGETARAMAEGALAKSGADLSGAVTGLAGPQGDDRGTPVGTVWIAASLRGKAHSRQTRVEHFLYQGNRAEIQAAAVMDVLRLVQDTARIYQSR